MIQTSLRINNSLYQRIAKQSKKDRRSINSEIIYIIERYLIIVSELE